MLPADPSCGFLARLWAYRRRGWWERTPSGVGGVAVCDLNAQIIASAATMPGSCLEVGAGRGTKTFIMAAQAERFGMTRDAIALELSKKKSRLNRRRLERAGLAGSVRCVTGDGCDLDRSLACIDERAGGTTALRVRLRRRTLLGDGYHAPSSRDPLEALAGGC